MMALVRDIPDPGFAGDDGSAPAALVEALRRYDARPDDLHAATLTVLQGARVLVPVVAVLGEVEVDAAGLVHDKTSDMATVLMQGRDGRTALLAFTSTGTMRRWNADARPVPVPVPRAAEAAVQDGAAAMLVDVAGPVPFVVETDDLHELARGHLLVRLAPADPADPAGLSDRYGWVTPGR
jgi:hypothetical protein